MIITVMIMIIMMITVATIIVLVVITLKLRKCVLVKNQEKKVEDDSDLINWKTSTVPSRKIKSS